MSNVLFDPLFGRHAKNDAPFLMLEKGRALSYGDFVALSARLANVFAEIGLTKGDRVALQVAKSPEALAVYAACLRSGLVLLPLNTAYTTSELAYFLGDAEPGLVICDAEDAVAMTGILKGAALHTLNADGSGSLSDAADAMPAVHAVVECGADDLAAILYTSGTTGRSKGAMLSHANLLSNATALADLWRFTDADVLLHALPIFHTHGLFVAVNVSALSGAAMIFHAAFKAEKLLADLPRATVLMGVPTFYTRLLAEPSFTREATAHMRLFVSGSAPLLADTHTDFEARTGHRILERYGMTETNMNASNPYEGDRRPGTVGFPLPGTEIRISDPDTGIEVPQGETGMIEVRGPNVFSGYWRMPEKTAEELRENGFFITGDLGQIDPDGYLVIVGRQKDLIISGGYNIYPKEIEVLLDALPGVRESAVFGVADPDFGEATIGVVVPEPGNTLDPAALLSEITPHLARFKHPRRIEIVADLPRNTMGKVQKNILRQTYTSDA
ncbi:Long-chain-fatty-acid--CoA ligase [Thalassovita gelatinovora]|uniref:Long-chain-fatty-acid--CoA ligase n=1 Tax=Thalassovita gelatinovora TaxID=53501 RepID=A0A0P1FCP9_THAGE|nr:malonyl-CoA synthase [Thalassovita gelatinovora]QIZ80460.1 malonyl-CoA synthase [Thalassovita gelatinovora]CUH65878.1 Long-chain-fatty-acid--CoA ligase [Thalassovita gelatinovora]SEQ73088.1 malonyl-CoA/methylmalonyl-CoA synthetase [Thalassovita gelatinovora]